MTQTLCTTSTRVSISDYVIPLGSATTDVSIIILMLFRQLGALSNNIFFVCSAWFLIGKTTTVRKKAFNLLCTVWVVAILFLFAYLAFSPFDISFSDILRQIVPSTSLNNWYMTCYIIFLFVYPYLNKIIDLLDQKQLLRVVLFSSFLYIAMNYIMSGLFFTSNLILWITIFLLMAYLKLYCQGILNVKTGYLLILIGGIGFVGQVVITNVIGLHLSVVSNNVMWWNKSCCPFYIMIALGSLIVALQAHYKVRAINYISSLSLFIYLIHENYLFRNYSRPYIWQWLYLQYGYSHVVLLVLIFASCLFCASCIVSAAYKATIQRRVNKCTDSLFKFISIGYRKVESLLIK